MPIVPTLAGVEPLAGVEEADSANRNYTEHPHTNTRKELVRPKEPPHFLFLLFIESRHAGHHGHDAHVTSHAPCELPIPHLGPCRTTRFTNKLCATCVRRALYRTRPNNRAQLKLKHEFKPNSKEELKSILSRTCQRLFKMTWATNVILLVYLDWGLGY
jgi:hypothetical protein